MDLGGPTDGAVRAALADAIASLKERRLGAGPTAARAFVEDDIVLVVCEGGLTRQEETLLADGREDLARASRLAATDAVAPEAMAAVAEVLGRRVVACHSQVAFDPVRLFDVFELAPDG